MQTIVPNIWCNGNALEAAEHYPAILTNTEFTNVVRYPTEGLLDFQQPMAGQPLTVDVEIQGYRLTLINADGKFRPNPSISFMVTSSNKELTQVLWDALSAVPEAERYGRLRDEFGLAWENVPDNLGELMSRPGAYEKLMSMGKIIVADL